MTLTAETKEILAIFQRADQEMQGLIFRMIVLAGKYGMPFLEETDGPTRAGDRKAFKEIIEKWEAKLLEEGAGPQ